MINIPLPTEPRHQRYADRRLSGDNITDAYLAAGYVTGRKSANAGGQRLERNAEVIAYMAAVRSHAADQSVMTLLERRRFYARIVRTPLMAIDPHAQDSKDGDLIRKFKSSSSESNETWEIEKLDPLKACELDTKAAGEDSESLAIGELADALKALVPASVHTRGKL